MRVRNLALSCLPILLICLTFIPNVRAQTTTISNLQYPTEVMLQSGVTNPTTITFTVNYVDLPSGYSLVIGIIFSGTSNYVTGSVSSTPDSCGSMSGTKYANSAVCVTLPAAVSGTEIAVLSLQFNAAQQYTLEAIAGVAYQSNVVSHHKKPSFSQISIMRS